VTATNVIAETVHEFVRNSVAGGLARPRAQTGKDEVWRHVRAAGSKLWLDTGDIDEAAKLWNAEFEALTTNNTLLNREVQKGIYDELAAQAASAIRRVVPDVSDRQVVLEVGFALNACHGLKLVQRFDAHVSVELHTDLAHDVDRTVAYGKRYYEICPEKFYIKVPLTPAGFLGARKLGALGIPVNFTLGFSARQNYLAALLTQPRYVNVFLGRLNSFVADNALGDGKNVGERATLAAQKALFDLRNAGRTKSLMIAASIRDGDQVAALVSVDVLTIPPKAAAQYQMNPPDELMQHVGGDLALCLAQGVNETDFNASTLWDVPDPFKRSVDDILNKDVDSLLPDDLQRHFEKAGFPDFLPRWSDEDRAAVAADGKIPVYEKWRDRLASGEIGLDALMNVSALHSFITDQKALDDRVQSLL